MWLLHRSCAQVCTDLFQIIFTSNLFVLFANYESVVFLQLRKLARVRISGSVFINSLIRYKSKTFENNVFHSKNTYLLIKS
jgi:hypothetical protein